MVLSHFSKFLSQPVVQNLSREGLLRLDPEVAHGLTINALKYGAVAPQETLDPQFFETEIAPYHEKWEEQQHLDRDLWNKAGELGLLCPTMPEEFGGSGVDRLFSMIMMEEQARVGDSASGFSLHSDIVANYILNFGNDVQKQN